MKTGAIVARFQVGELHAGHHHLIQSVYKKSDQVVICLGEPAFRDEKNILPFEIRRGMILETYPGAKIYKIRDHRESNELWSGNLDMILNEFENVTLYGSRDSFNSFYTGKYPYEEIPELVGFNGTLERNKMLAAIPNNTPDYRKGLIKGYHLKEEYNREFNEAYKKGIQNIIDTENDMPFSLK